MKDFFKELNIIDILGIGVPGCLLVLLWGGDQTAKLLWMEQFELHPLAFGVVLTVVGSLAGMLLQELGDMIEKGLWMIPWMDPKVYAAVAVKLDDNAVEELRNHKSPSLNEKTARCFQILASVATLALIGVAAGLLPGALWNAQHVTNDGVYVTGCAWLGLLPLVIPVVCMLRCIMILPKINKQAEKNTKAEDPAEPTEEEKAWKNLMTIRQANPYIQTVLVGHGNTSKRTLYDGWRFVMRNLILVLALSNLVCMWKPLDLYCHVAKAMTPADGNMTCNLFWLTFIASVAISLMLIRYYHYAFLRYKYSLEDYIQLRQERPTNKSP